MEDLLRQSDTKTRGFLAGSEASGIVGEAALRVVLHPAYWDLPTEVSEAVHALFDLHDGTQTTWAPRREVVLAALETIHRFLSRA